MFVSQKSIARHATIVGLLSAIVFGSVPAFAATTPVSQAITAGGSSVTLSTPSFASLVSQHVAVNNDAATVLTVDDSTGNGVGWAVSMISTALAGAPSGTIPATAILVNSLGGVAMVAGTPGLPTAGTPGDLSGARIVLTAATATGQGTYTENVGLRIVVPADLHAGAYTGTITITSTAGA